MKALLRAGRPVMSVDVFQARRDRGHRWFLTYNLTDDALRVHDIVNAMAGVRGPVELVGIGEAAVWCLFAAAAEGGVWRGDLNGFGGSDREFVDRFFVPGIQWAGGLEGALRLVR